MMKEDEIMVYDMVPGLHRTQTDFLTRPLSVRTKGDQRDGTSGLYRNRDHSNLIPLLKIGNRDPEK